MTQLTRAQFLDLYRQRAIDVARVDTNGTAAQELRDVGQPLDDLLRHDAFARDGRIQGEAELTALFGELRTLNPAGADALLIADASGNATRAGRVLHALDLLFTEPASLPAAAALPLPTPVELSAAVGAGQPNRADDVRALQHRLNELGLKIDVDGQYGGQTESAIRVYLALLSGVEHVRNVTPRVKAGDRLLRVINSPNAPRWMELPGRGLGFINHDQDNHDYGWSHLIQVVRDAGRRYEESWLRAHPRASPIATNDASRALGGDTRDHASHEAGLDLDIRLPRTDGDSGTDISNGAFDVDAAYAMVTAFASDPRVERVLFNSRECLDRARRRAEPWAGKLQQARGHNDHIHVDVKPTDVA